MLKLIVILSIYSFSTCARFSPTDMSYRSHPACRTGCRKQVTMSEERTSRMLHRFGRRRSLQSLGALVAALYQSPAFASKTSMGLEGTEIEGNYFVRNDQGKDLVRSIRVIKPCTADGELGEAIVTGGGTKDEPDKFSLPAKFQWLKGEILIDCTSIGGEAEYRGQPWVDYAGALDREVENYDLEGKDGLLFKDQILLDKVFGGRSGRTFWEKTSDLERTEEEIDERRERDWRRQVEKQSKTMEYLQARGTMSPTVKAILEDPDSYRQSMDALNTDNTD